MIDDGFASFTKEWAIHPHWRGNLLLEPDGTLVIHEGIRSFGRYEIVGDELSIHWEKFGPDHFTRINNTWIHHKVLAATTKIQDLGLVRAFDRTYVTSRLRMHVPEANGEVELRLHTSDVLTFWQVFINLEYDSPNLPPSARTIVDLGANIGLATQYFAARYPSAHIVAVEPDADNFALLMRNTAPLGTRVHRHHGAAWIHDGQISLRTEDEAQRPLGAWGTQVTATPRPGESRVPCYRLATLLDLAGFETVDILKVDIEGAELEVFTDGVQDCLDRIGLVIVETHDRFRPGSEAAVRNALGPQFRELPQKGENLFFARIT